MSSRHRVKNMYIGSHNAMKVAIFLLFVQVTKAAVDEQLTCSVNRLPRFPHTEFSFAQWPASDECQKSYEVECEEGYEMTLVRKCQKTNDRSCQPPDIICTIISCDVPYAIPNATVEYNTTTYLSRAVYKCDEGLFLTSGLLEKTCLSDKQWSFNDPYCSHERPTTTAAYNITTTEEVVTTATVINNTATGIQPVIQVYPYNATEAENADLVGGISLFVTLSPVVFLIIIDVCQISLVVKAKIIKAMAKRAAAQLPV